MSTQTKSLLDRRKTPLIAVLLAAYALSGCSGWSRSRRPNVVLIVVDTLRADRLPFYGNSQNTAPFLSQLAERSTVFDNAWSPSSWTLPATVSVLTSVHPFQHGVNSLDGLELEPGEKPQPVNAIPDALETLAEVLSDAGYSTFGIASNILVGEEVGFERGFDRFVRLDDEDADIVNGQLEQWRSEILDSDPYFLYVHYFDPHDPFHNRDPWFHPTRSRTEAGWPAELIDKGVDTEGDLDWILGGVTSKPVGFENRNAGDLSDAELARLLAWFRAAYDSEINFVDARIREAFDMLELDDSIVIFLSDHGEEFYEHGDFTHGQNLYGETTRVPLLVYLPDDETRGGRVKSDVSTLDIVPTVRQLLGLPPSPQDEGQDLFADGPRPPVFGFLAGGEHLPEDDMRSIVRGNHRLIDAGNGRAELYDLARDPLERTDLAESFPDITAELLRELDRLESAAPSFPPSFRVPENVSDEILEHLKGLGYLGR